MSHPLSPPFPLPAPLERYITLYLTTASNPTLAFLKPLLLAGCIGTSITQQQVQQFITEKEKELAETNTLVDEDDTAKPLLLPTKTQQENEAEAARLEEEGEGTNANVFIQKGGDIAHGVSSHRKRPMKLGKQQPQQKINTYYTPPVLPAQQVLKQYDEQQQAARTVDLHIENFDLAFAGLQILTDANLHLAYARRYGLVGRNGMGKSTLMRAIANREINVPKGISILLVDQEVPANDTNITQAVLEADIYRETLLKKLNDADPDDDVADIHARLADIDSDKAEARAAAILDGLGFGPEDRKRACSTFSGGWRMRVALARALYCKPELLLLDEPTNMLDVPAVIWLERYLETWESTLLVVSHDRTFLTNLCTDIIHLQNKKLVPYKGDFVQFLATKDEKYKNTVREYEAQMAYRAHLQEFIDRWKYNAKKASLAQMKIKILEKLPVIEKPELEDVVTFRFDDVEPLSPPILQMGDMTFGYTQEKIILKDVNFDMLMTSRMAVIGPNGAGKSTLLKILTGQLEPLSGAYHRNAKLRVAVFSQHHIDSLDLNVSPVSFLATNFPGKQEEEYRRCLGAFGITGMTGLQKIGTLSGGQRSRVAFAVMNMMNPHFLIFDEPTNFLDLDSIDALAIAISHFNGGVIVVSHDEKFISTVCQEIWIVDKQKVSKFYGSFIEYKKAFVKQMEKKVDEMTKSSSKF